MASMLLELKLDRAFGHLDVNRNGHIDHDDITRLATRLADGFGESTASPKGQALVDGLEEFWTSLVAAVDHDGDGSITPKEWQAGMITAFVEPEAGFDQGFQPAAEAIMGLADTDDDGAVAFDEFKTLLKAFGAPAKDAKAAFEHLDADGDGSLTVEELVLAARQYYTGTQPAAGDWLFGKV
ncbi:Ca2+-binding EF-hand superfamily protein [Allocatelliglobosispora scoriae]|uniref:Ca2+-binding EF-hand superfamily protein n=1 Tax=Allocatelliglobosispora scoriae TaxID=643052 RepID=A0A841BPN0_9ACTN|nr:EF-hand domain-containing protein [Allocatelliglobosispora scoriae]MBB5868903.1 Ca2+-binding EF-hand superfamily protein [Allocatelliglobosispora scoriae]